MQFTSITYLKAIGIILMVAGHAHIPHIFREILSLFHIPLFFMASGYCFKSIYIKDFKQFSLKRFQGIWWPCAKWTLLFVLLHNFFFHLNIINDEYGLIDKCATYYSFQDILLHARNAFFLICEEYLLAGYWFLKSLFWGSFLFYFTLRLFYKFQLHYLAMGVFLLLLSTAMAYQFREFTIFHISSWDFHAAFFIWCGYAYRLAGLKWERNVKMLLIGSVAVALLGITFWKGSMTDISFKRFLPITMSAIILTLTTYGLCNKISETTKSHFCVVFIKKTLDFIGRNTLTILTWHFLSFKIVSFAIVKVYGLPPKQLGEFPVIRQFDDSFMWILYLFIGLAIPLCLAYLNNFIPNKYLKL